MQFLYQPLTWAFFLVLAPLLIHLINLMRQRRIKWAAMEFLLKSYKKSRRWVWLKQLLLLLLRMLAITTIVAMLAKLVTRDEWSNLFSGRSTHHYIVLDDSFSMSDRTGSIEVFDLAQQAVAEICVQAAKQNSLQKATLIRYSQAGKTAANSELAAAIPDLNSEIINSTLQQLLQDKNRSIHVSDLAIGPVDALVTVENLIGQATDEKPIVHLISDFRSEDWQDPGDIRDALQRLVKSKAVLKFVKCAENRQPNLGIVDIGPAAGIQAAGVPLFVNVKVKNYGPNDAQKVQIKVHTELNLTAADGSAMDPRVEELPSLLIDDLAAGQTVTRQVQVFFPTDGQHVVTAELTPDAVEPDNKRWVVLDLQEGVPTLLIENDIRSRSAYFLQAVFQPGPRTNTGIRPVSQPVSFLRDSSPEDLSRYSVIYLLDVPQLDGRSLENLDSYVKKGGGLAVFLGPSARTDFYNDWYADGEGLFPIAIDKPVELPRSANGIPDVVFLDHPIFQALKGERNPFAAALRIQQYFKPDASWQPPEDSTIEVLATLRNGDPFIVERGFGEGRVFACTTTADPRWNNWARQPNFIITILEAHSYLSLPFRKTVTRLVGSPIDLRLDATKFLPEIEVSLPGDNDQIRTKVSQTAEATSQDAPTLNYSIGVNPDDDKRTGETDRQGVYDVAATTTDGNQESRRFALNTDAVESELALIGDADLKKNLDPVPFTIHRADEIVYGTVSDDGTSWSEVLLVSLVLVLLVEQFLGYSASYHASTKAGGVA